MARIKGAMMTRKRRNKVLKAAKGYWGSKSKHFKMAKEAVMKSGNYAFAGRRRKKRDFRRLWITRISAGCKTNGMNYSSFMNGLKKAGVTRTARCFPRSPSPIPPLSPLCASRRRLLCNSPARQNPVTENRVFVMMEGSPYVPHRLSGARRTAGKPPERNRYALFLYRSADRLAAEPAHCRSVQARRPGSVSARDCSVLTASNCCARLSAGRCR